MLLGCLWRVLTMISQQIGVWMGAGWVKVAPSWCKMRPSWTMLAPRWRLDAQWGVFWVDFRRILDRFWEHFSTWAVSWEQSLQKWSKCKNEQHYSVLAIFSGLGGSFFHVFCCWSGLLRRLGHCFEPCCLQDRLFCVTFGLCCDMLAPRWRPRAPR